MEIDSNPQETPVLQNPPESQVEKNALISQDAYQNTNYSQASENNEDNELTPGNIKSESMLNELEPNRMPEKDTSKKLQSKLPSTSSLAQTFPLVPKKWEWLPCNYELKREEKETETYWSLAPIIQLINSDSKTVPEIDISLDLERPFMYNPEVGWNWHKSWNLPNLTVNLKITDPKTKAAILPPADLKAQLLAVKVLLNKVEQVKLYDLGLKGGNAQDLSDGVCTFSGVKFSSTSYNNDGVKFHLVVLIYIQEDTRNRTCPKIMYSRISPPIFVDSRKAARNSHVFKNKKINSIYFDSFPPDTFTRIFVKRNSKLNDSKEEVIENSLDGLSHYFTAPNIRNKVKHPLFLAFKFSNCVKFYYNQPLLKKTAEKEELTQEDLIYNMQKVFLENHRNKKEKGEFQSGSNKAFDNKHFILVIEEPSNPDSFILNKKIGDYLDPIINDVLHIIFNSNLLPSHFEQFPTDELAGSYTSVYPKLQELRETYGLTLEDNDDDYEESKNTPTSHEMGLKEEINVKRERSEDDTSEVDYGDGGDFDEEDEKDDENLNMASVSAPRKKVKTDNKKESAPKRTSSRAKIAKPIVPPKKEKKTPQRAPQQPKSSKAATKNPPQEVQPKMEIKTESDDVILKSEEDNSSTRYDKNASVRSVSEKAPKMKEPMKKPQAQTSVNVGYQSSPKDLGAQKFGESMSMLQPNLDLMLGMQQQQQRQDLQKNQLMMMMYQNYGKNPQDLQALTDFQGINPLLFQQQQQQQLQHHFLQKQLPQQLLQQSPHQQQMLEAQLVKQQQQLWQLQQKLNFMQTTKGHEKDKSAQNEAMNKSLMEASLTMPGQFGLNKGLNPQMLNSVLGKPQQLPGVLPGLMGNRQFNIYGGLPLDQEGANPYAAYMNLQQDPTGGKPGGN